MCFSCGNISEYSLMFWKVVYVQRGAAVSGLVRQGEKGLSGKKTFSD